MREDGHEAVGRKETAKPEWGPCPTGVWPQFRTIQEKEVTILNSTECDSLYHRFSKIPSLIQIINSQMICAKDVDREQFCYVSTSPTRSLASKGTWPGVGWGTGETGPEGRGNRKWRVGDEQG